MKLSKAMRTLLAASFGSLYIGGTSYWLSRLFLTSKGEFGDEPHWLERLAGPIHVIFAFLFLFVVGVLWAHHITPALKARKDRQKNRMSGWIFLSLLFFVSATAVTNLYGSQKTITLSGWAHPLLGVLLLPALAVHRKTRKR